MKIFVIHRFEDRHNVKKNLNSLAKELSLDINFFFLSNTNNEWKKKAKKAILSSEVVIIYDTTKCIKSPNSKWEIEFAKSKHKKIIEIANYNNDSLKVKQEILSIYHFDKEFNDCIVYKLS